MQFITEYSVTSRYQVENHLSQVVVSRAMNLTLLRSTLSPKIKIPKHLKNIDEIDVAVLQQSLEEGIDIPNWNEIGLPSLTGGFFGLTLLGVLIVVYYKRRAMCSRPSSDINHATRSRPAGGDTNQVKVVQSGEVAGREAEVAPTAPTGVVSITPPGGRKLYPQLILPGIDKPDKPVFPN